jgi:hypothetical protein
MFLACHADKFVYFRIHDWQSDKFHQCSSEMRISAADYFTRLAIPHAQHPRCPRTRTRGPAAREKTEETSAEFPNAHGGFVFHRNADSHEQTEYSPDERLFFSHKASPRRFAPR